MAAEAASANRAKTDFLSTMSHDIRTPMNAIIGLTVLAERNLGDRESVRDNLKKISLASNHLLTLIMRFLEGDVPMMICSGDTVSGTRKRESQSEAFTKAPFTYTFLPVPLTEEGGIFLDRPSLQFSVNKDCENLDMTNEFMRFLITEPELNAISEAKRLVTPARDLSVDSIYAAFEQVPAKRIISPEALGIMDVTTVQLRGALFNVMNGSMTIDEAIAAYGSFEL